MKIILLKHIKGLGREGDIVEVSDGYANNSLFPRSLAQQATAAIINRKKMAEKSLLLKEKKEKELILSKLNSIDGKIIIFNEKLNPKGSLYHALGVKEIIRAIKEQYDLSIPNFLFKEKYSFKEKGEHSIELEAYKKTVRAKINIKEID